MGHTVSKNYLYNLIYQVVSILAQVITLPYLTRIIGEDGIGIQSYTNSVVSLLMVFAVLGIDWYGQREAAKEKGRKKRCSEIFWELCILKFFSFLVLSPGFLILVFADKKYAVYYLALLILYIGTMFDISWFYKGLEDFKRVSLRNCFVKIVGIVFIFLFVKEKKDILKYIVILSCSTLFANLTMWVGVGKVLVKLSYRDLRIRRHIKYVVQYFIPTLASSVYLLLDKAMIGVITKNDYQNGFYEQAVQVINMMKTVVLSYNMIMISRMTVLYQSNQPAKIRGALDKSCSFISFVGWPMCFGLLSIAPEFVRLYYDTMDMDVVNILYMFSPVILFVGISNMLESHIITPLNMRGKGNAAVVAGAVSNFFMNIILIPYFHAAGAAFASVLAEFIIMILYIVYSNKYYAFKYIVKNAYKKCIASVSMFFLLRILVRNTSSDILTLVIKTGFGAVVYVLVLCVLGDDLVVDAFRYGKKFLKKSKWQSRKRSGIRRLK